MRASLPIGVMLLAAVLSAQRGAADVLTPLVDDRYALVDHCPAFGPCEADSRRPSPPFASFDDEASAGNASASQRSQLVFTADEARLDGALAASGPSPATLGNTTADAVFDVAFEAAQAASFAWTASGTATAGGYGAAFLYDLSADRIVYERSLPGGFQRSGSLEAGHRYQLYLGATTLGEGSAAWSFAFEVALPEPGGPAAAASGAGLVALLARRRRGARSPR